MRNATAGRQAFDAGDKGLRHRAAGSLPRRFNAGRERERDGERDRERQREIYREREIERERET